MVKKAPKQDLHDESRQKALLIQHRVWALPLRKGHFQYRSTESDSPELSAHVVLVQGSLQLPLQPEGHQGRHWV